MTNTNNHDALPRKYPVLYQSTPRRRNTYHRQKSRRDWSDSIETYQNAAKQQYYLLLENHRQANHLMTLKYLREFTAQEIRAIWSKLKALLKKQGIVAFSVVEFTTRSKVLTSGGFWDFPINTIHYHILVDSSLSERQLRDIFNSACIEVGLAKNEFEVHYASIPDRTTFEHKCKYILKYDNFKDYAILPQPKTGINKICSIGKWFVNADGTRANKDTMWKEIVAGWYPKTKQP